MQRMGVTSPTLTHDSGLSKNKRCIAIDKLGRFSLRKYAYSNILKNSHHWKFSDKNSDIFHISAQNIDWVYSLEPPRWGGSNEYPQFMFWAEIRKIMYTPVNPSFTIIKLGFNGVKII